MKRAFLLALVLTGCLPDSRYVPEEWTGPLELDYFVLERLVESECVYGSATDATLAAAEFGRRSCPDVAGCETLELPVWSTTDRWSLMGHGVHDGRRGLIALLRRDAAGREAWVVDDRARAVFGIRADHAGADTLPPMSLLLDPPYCEVWQVRVGRGAREVPETFSLGVSIAARAPVGAFASRLLPGEPMTWWTWTDGRDHLGPAGQIVIGTGGAGVSDLQIVNLRRASVPATDGAVLEDRFITEERAATGTRTLIVRAFVGDYPDATITADPFIDDAVDRAAIARGIDRLAWLELAGPDATETTYSERALVSAPEPAGDPFVVTPDHRVDLGPGPIVELVLGSTHAAFIEDGSVHVVELATGGQQVIPPRAEPWQIVYVGPTEIALARSVEARPATPGSDLAELRFVRLTAAR